MQKKKRILIKLSGEALKQSDKNIFDFNKIDFLLKQVATLSKKFSIGIVVGGGNIWRGNMNKSNILTKADADYMGMTSTLMNAIALKSNLAHNNVKAKIFSALVLQNVTNPICIDKINEALDEGNIAIFAGGTGHPYFTTDTCAALRAIDINADVILMGKNGVNGVYSDDPKKNKNAKLLKNLTFDQVIEKNLKVMDVSALALCRENNINIIVFDVLSKNGIINAANKKATFTYINRR